jgi:hypothetical protein
MKPSILVAVLLLIASAGTAHAFTVESADDASGEAALLNDPDDALQKKFDDRDGVASFRSGPADAASGFSFGFTGPSSSRFGGSTYNRLMPWADQPSSAPSLSGGWR